MVVAMTVAVAMMVEAAQSRRVLRHNADKARASRDWLARIDNGLPEAEAHKGSHV